MVGVMFSSGCAGDVGKIIRSMGDSDSSGMEDRVCNSEFRVWGTSLAIASLSDSVRDYGKI